MRCYRTHKWQPMQRLPTCQPLGEYMILSVSASSTITFFASRWVSARKKTSAAAKRKREHADASKAPIYPDIHNNGIDRLLSKIGRLGLLDLSRSTKKQKKGTTYDWSLRHEAQTCQGRSGCRSDCDSRNKDDLLSKVCFTRQSLSLAVFSSQCE